MELLETVVICAGWVALAAAVPLACHLCIRSFWKAVGCSLLYYVMVWPADVPTIALVPIVPSGLLIVLARSRWKAAASWLIPAALLAWCVAVAFPSEDRWVMLLSVPALAPLPVVVGVFVAAFRREWSAVKWGRIATIALGLYSIWWWAEMFPTVTGSNARISSFPITVDGVILLAATISFFFEKSRHEWVAYGAGSLAFLALAFVWVDRATSGSRDNPGVKCLTVVHQIVLYAREHGDAHAAVLPDSLETLSREYGSDFDQHLSCPWAHIRGIPASEDGYEYVGAGLRVSDIKNPQKVPIVFDRAGNHRNHTRSVGFVDGGVEEPTERQFRALLLRAVLASAYPPATVEELKAQEPWLAKEMAEAK